MNYKSFKFDKYTDNGVRLSNGRFFAHFNYTTEENRKELKKVIEFVKHLSVVKFWTADTCFLHSKNFSNKNFGREIAKEIRSKFNVVSSERGRHSMDYYIDFEGDLISFQVFTERPGVYSLQLRLANEIRKYLK